MRSISPCRRRAAAALVSWREHIPRFVLNDYEHVDLAAYRLASLVDLPPDVIDPQPRSSHEGPPADRLDPVPGLGEDITFSEVESSTWPPTASTKPTTRRRRSCFVRLRRKVTTTARRPARSRESCSATVAGGVPALLAPRSVAGGVPRGAPVGEAADRPEQPPADGSAPHRGRCGDLGRRHHAPGGGIPRRARLQQLCGGSRIGAVDHTASIDRPRFCLERRGLRPDPDRAVAAASGTAGQPEPRGRARRRRPRVFAGRAAPVAGGAGAPPRRAGLGRGRTASEPARRAARHPRRRGRAGRSRPAPAGVGEPVSLQAGDWRLFASPNDARCRREPASCSASSCRAAPPRAPGTTPNERRRPAVRSYPRPTRALRVGAVGREPFIFAGCRAASSTSSIA